MKRNIISLRPVGFGVLTLLTLVWITGTQRAVGQNTAFTYQGRLNASGGPANGVYDFTFQTFDAVIGGASIGGTVNVNGVGVTNGLFTALVDLGSTPFTGPARWLQISVRTNGAGSFTILTPRQPLTPSPYAIYANTAGTVTNGAIANAQLAANAVAAGNIQNTTITAGKIASGQVVKSLNGLTDAVSLTQGANVTINTVGNSLQISAPAGGLNLPFSGSASSTGSVFTLSNSASGAAAAFLGKVGVGTPAPGANLEIRSTGSEANLHLDATTPGGTPVIRLRQQGTNKWGWLGEFPGGGAATFWSYDSNRSVLTMVNSGRVGIGTDTPQARLDVRGDVTLGRNGEFRATSGEENLRIVRGRISASGAHVGSGYGVNHSDTGYYTISFITPFVGDPAVTATASFDEVFVTAFIQNTFPRTVVVTVRDVSTRNLVDSDFSFIAIGSR